MGRTVSAVVTHGEDGLGVIGPFAVGTPWWSEVATVTAHLSRSLGTPVLVLRLLTVSGGEGGRDGHVTYHAEALHPPPDLTTGKPGAERGWTGVPAGGDQSERLRVPWAEAGGLRELLRWAEETLTAAGRPVVGPVLQHRTWNLAGLFRLPTARGPVWLKVTPHFAADEAGVIAAFARHDPGLVPDVVAAGPRRILLEHLPGEDCWDASPEVITSAVRRLVAAQAAIGADWPDGLPDRRGAVLDEQVGTLLDGLGLTAGEHHAARTLLGRRRVLDDCGLPDTLVHGDFHPGNWRSDGGPPVVMDFADAHIGHPVLDGLRVCDFLPPAKRPVAARTWIDAWRSAVPGSDPERALAVAEPLAHLAYAVRYQEFLDGIEPSERVYHQGDPAASVRAALRCAS
jgi:hypothetical protein